MEGAYKELLDALEATPEIIYEDKSINATLAIMIQITVFGCSFCIFDIKWLSLLFSCTYGYAMV